MALWQAISNESKTSSIWLVRVPSKPISHENGYHMHFLARNNHKFQFHNKETHNWNITTSSTNHRVRYGIRSELCLTLQHNRGVREKYKMALWRCSLTNKIVYMVACGYLKIYHHYHCVYLVVTKWCLKTSSGIHWVMMPQGIIRE